MNPGTIIGIAIAALVVLGIILFLTSIRRQDVRGAGALSRETRKRDKSGVSAAPSEAEEQKSSLRQSFGALTKAESLPPAPFTPPDPEEVGVNRRQFFNRASVTLMNVGLGGFGIAVVAFLWPKKGGGFGGKVPAGKVDDILANIEANDGFYYLPEARTWLTHYPKEALRKAETVYSPAELAGMQVGLIALSQKCPHLGCRVPECKSSQWFECQCHGSQYNRVGEKKAGPAPRGMDRHPLELANGLAVVNTGVKINGPTIGTNTTGQEAEGPHCVGSGEGGH